ncbi:translocation/assembly module TamB domain-containing protein [Cyanobacterium stanieri LEGE 03274]|uniref:Translocation/assembly module TamB domain-containing protein n=1 Tax=Cyanobacterium stanieri LEGE 03274 TaxID=1828756 RepID=A0ABR9V2F8_9CHRO|nr:translocation/assembly module TamB domain-containing protein [Cyanobacterium stanieri]MBE9222037.1 translocation/assembly module TamB domain-containing protein [Cyanobacterium stanieri LEGE 03274]
MTNPQSPQPEENSNTLFHKLKRVITSPRTIIIVVVGGGAIASGAYLGAKYIITEVIPATIEDELKKALEREVNIGEITSFGFSHLTINDVTLPPTSEDNSFVEIKNINAQFNPLNILFQNQLPLDITIEEITALGQLDTLITPTEEEESEIPETIDLPELPITADINLDIEKATLAITPNATTQAIDTENQINLNLLYNNDTNPLRYNIQSKIDNSSINLRGETILATTQSNNNIKINYLDLTKLNDIVSSALPLNINQGNIDINLEINIPSFTNLRETQAYGSIALNQLEGDYIFSGENNQQTIIQPLRSEAYIKVDGQTIDFLEANANFGNLAGNLTGNIDLNQGYNIQGNLNPINVNDALASLAVISPVTLNGILQGDLAITGEIDNPQINTNLAIENTIVDQMDLGQTVLSLDSNLDAITLNRLEINPTAGGEVFLSGLINTNLREKITNQETININDFPLQINLDADLPTQELINVYNLLPPEITVSRLQATGNIIGNIGNPSALVNFNLPDNNNQELGNITGRGELAYDNNQLRVNNTQLIVNDGTINVNGLADLETSNWNADLVINSLTLTPFVRQYCLTMGNCPENINTATLISANQGNIQARGNFNNLDLDNIDAISNLQLNVDRGSIEVDSRLENGVILANADAREINLNNLITDFAVDTNIITSNLQLESSIQELITLGQRNLTTLNLNLSSEVLVNGGLVNVSGGVNPQNTAFLATASGINLNNLNPVSPITVETSRVNLSLLTTELINNQTNFTSLENIIASLPSLTVNADNSLLGGGGVVNSQTNISNGLVRVNANAQNINAQQLIADFPLDVNQVNSQINVNVSLQEVVATAINYLDTQTLSPLNSLVLNANSNFNLAQGGGVAVTNISNNQWGINLNTEDINIDNLAQQLALNLDNQLLANSPLNSQVNLRGSLAPIFSNNPSAVVEVTQALVNVGETNLNARGRFDVINLVSNLDITNVVLDIETQADLETIPANAILAQFPQEEGIRLLPDEANLSGIGNFVGRFTGNNLLTNPLGENNLRLGGDIEVANLIFNDIQFESFLAGNLNVNGSEGIILDLRGEEDVIYARLIPNNITPVTSDNYIAFIPDQVLISQGGEDGFLVQGERRGEEFTATVNNFNLASLRISPVANFGIVGNLQGRVEQQTTVNLRDFSSRGNIRLKEIGIGNIIANEINADFVFRDDVAQLREASLRFGDSVYALQGSFNLATQDIEGRLNVDGDVRDIFTTLQISDVETLTSILQQIQTQDVFASADSIPPQSVGDGDDTIGNQVNLLANIDRQIKEVARQIQEGGIPSNLDVMGVYRGEVVIGGNLRNPIVNVDFEGRNWQWLPQPAYPDVVDGLGLVIQQSQPVIIPQITLGAEFRDNNLEIQPFVLGINDSEVAFAGNLSWNRQEGDFRVSNLSLDTFSAFIPDSDFGGILDMEGSLSGNLLNPVIEGNVVVRDSSFDGAILAQEVRGDFVYEDYLFNFASTAPEEIQITSTLPYHPLLATPFPATLNVSLSREALEVLGILTQGQLALTGGDANAQFDVEIASLNRFIENPDLNQVQVRGKVNLDNAQLESSSIEDSVIVSGEVDIDGRAIALNQVQAKIKDTEINLGGSLPLTTAQPDNENPLTISIPNQTLDLTNLYRGGVNAEIRIDGTVLNPVVGGFFHLARGRVSIPNLNNNGQPLTPEEINIASQWLGENGPISESIFQPQINNFEVNLKDLDISQFGVYRFLFDGDLVVNGRGLNPDNITAQGQLNLRRGRINIGGSSGSGIVTNTIGEQNTFYLSRTNENRVTFRPNQSILNPEVDILVEGDVVDYSRQLSTTRNNEILDPIVRGGRGETVRVELAIRGNLQSLTPLITGQTANNSCNVTPSDNVIVNQPEEGWNQEKLDSVARCTTIASRFNPDNTNLEILNSPLVRLTSIPGRGQGELVNLIVGGQFLGLLNQLEGSGDIDLIESGLLQFVVVPLLNDVTFGINERVSTWGSPLGMSDLRVFPLVEGVYPLQNRSNISVSYDYIFNEFRIRYQRRF